MGFIYKITNSVNSKVYIGQTRRTIKERWKEHLYDAFSTKHPSSFYFHRALRKYGKEAFSVEEIEECSNDDLDTREKYWILYYHSNKDGYNIDLGGKGNKGHPVYQYAIDGTFLHEYETIKDARDAIEGRFITFNENDPTLIIGGYLWRRFKADKIDGVDVRPHEKIVYQYTMDGMYITSYESLVKAAQAVRGRDTGTLIGAVCRGDRRCAYGYRWSFDKVECLPDMVPHKRQRKVIRISLDGLETKVYNTIQEAAQDNNALSPNIIQVCQGHHQTCCGYRWKYYDDQKV